MWLSETSFFNGWLLKLSEILIFLIFLLYLSVVNLIYTNVDLFKIDIAEVKKNDNGSMKKLENVIKKSYIINSSVCIIQNIINVLFSYFFFFNDGIWPGLITTLFVMFFSEIIPNYLVSNYQLNGNREYLLNKMFLCVANFIANFSPLNFFFIKNKNNKIFSHNEEDLIRFVNNLTSKEILLLEQKEAQLVNLAFKLDDKDIKNTFVPNKEIVFLKEDMEFEDVKKMFVENKLTRYPVLDKKEDYIGIFGIKDLMSLSFKNENSKEIKWTNFIEKKISSIDSGTKLSEALEILKNSEEHISFVKEKGEIVGIITLKDVLGSLIGKISGEETL